MPFTFPPCIPLDATVVCFDGINCSTFHISLVFQREGGFPCRLINLMPPKHLYVLPEGTCCFRAALHFAQTMPSNPEMVVVASFYEGMNRLKELGGGDEGSYLLVPDISEANAVITEAPGWSWEPSLSFPLENPPLHYARSKRSTVPNHQSRCATIPALRPLLENDPMFARPDKFEFHDVHSTQEAAIAAIEGEAGFCITNQSGMDKAKGKLDSILTLKQMTVFWKLFRYQSH